VQRWKLARGKNRGCKSPHHGSKSGELRDVDGALVQRGQQLHDFVRLCAPGKQFFHDRFRFQAREDVTGFDVPYQLS
jgi:hypothetical protein